MTRAGNAAPQGLGLHQQVASTRREAVRRLLLIPILSAAVILAGCHGTESPTEPVATNVTVNVFGENHLSSPIGLQHVLFGGGMNPLLTVAQGGAVELYRWSGVGAILNAPFVVLRPSSSDPATFVPWAEVYYNFSLPTPPQSDYSIVISLSLDQTGLLTATSSRPDLLQIARISYEPGTVSHTY